MDWIATPESSNIQKFKFDETSHILTVEFKGGVMYNYFDIPEPLFKQMETASSKGQFIAQNIKGTYRYARA